MYASQEIYVEEYWNPEFTGGARCGETRWIDELKAGSDTSYWQCVLEDNVHEIHVLEKIGVPDGL